MFLLLSILSFAGETKYKTGTSTKTTDWALDWRIDPADLKTVGTGGDYEGLYKIVMYEGFKPDPGYKYADDPCQIDVHSRHLNTYNTKKSTSNHCRNKNGRSPKTIEFSNNDTYISGIQVCQGGTRHAKIKGLKVWSRKLNRATGTLEDKNHEKWERPNCKNWGTKRQCPAGQIAWKIEIDHENWNAGNQIRNIRLLCKKIVEK